MDMIANTTMGRALERKAFGRVLADGMLEIYLGALFMNAAAWIAAGEAGMGWGDSAVGPMIVLLLALGFYQRAKAKITKPRMGHFKIAPQRLTKKRLLLFLSVVVTALLVGLTILAGAGGWPEAVPFDIVVFGMLALQVVIGFALAAYFFGAQRFYVYALLGAVGMLGGEIVVAYRDVPRIWDVVGLLGLPALVMVPVGIVMLVRFLGEYPLERAA